MPRGRFGPYFHLSGAKSKDFLRLAPLFPWIKGLNLVFCTQAWESDLHALLYCQLVRGQLVQDYRHEELRVLHVPEFFLSKVERFNSEKGASNAQKGKHSPGDELGGRVVSHGWSDRRHGRDKHLLAT